jgi:hypothetical protein
LDKEEIGVLIAEARNALRSEDVLREEEINQIDPSVRPRRASSAAVC